jgi:hypothetical protein
MSGAWGGSLSAGVAGAGAGRGRRTGRDIIAKEFQTSFEAADFFQDRAQIGDCAPGFEPRGEGFQRREPSPRRRDPTRAELHRLAGPPSFFNSAAE